MLTFSYNARGRKDIHDINLFTSPCPSESTHCKFKQICAIQTFDQDLPINKLDLWIATEPNLSKDLRYMALKV